MQADGWKLQVTERPGSTWLFDLRSDPTAAVNIDKTLEEPDAPDDEHIFWPN